MLDVGGLSVTIQAPEGTQEPEDLARRAAYEVRGQLEPMVIAAILVGPEFGSVSRPDLVEAAREAADAGFDVLISCAFSYDAHASDLSKLGRIPVLKARMNADLHMADDLKNIGKGNLFVIFRKPDIEILPVSSANSGPEQFQVKLNGVDVFDPPYREGP